MGRPQRILSLDLGSATLKLALVEVRDETLKLLQARLLEVPAGADKATRQAALKELLQGIPLGRGIQIVSVIDDPFAFIQPVLVPPMSLGELAGAVTWELQRSLAFPAEEAIVDYEPLGEVQVGGTKKLKLLAAAFPGEKIRQHLSFLNQAGVKPTRLLPIPVSVAGWFSRSENRKEQLVALLSLGANSTEFLVTERGRIVFTRKIPVSASGITQAMTAVLMTAQGQVGLSEPEAETLKRSLGIPRAEASELTAHGISGAQLWALIRGNLERLALELERSLAFYGEFTGGSGVSELILVGGGAHLKGLPQWLQERLGIPVRVPDPLRAISFEPGALSGAASGMPLSLIPALGATFGKGTGINLLPQELKEAVAREIRRVALTGSLTAVLLGMLLVRVGMGIYHRVLLGQISAYRLEQAAIQEELAQAKVSMWANQRLSEEPLWEELFKELSQIVPKEVYLTALLFQERQVSLRGRVRELTRSSDKVLASFLKALGEGLLTEVRLSSSRQLEGTPKEAEFEILCSLR